MWELWHNRNDYVWKAKSSPALVIVSSALGSYLIGNQLTPNAWLLQTQRVSPPRTWQKLDYVSLKYNVDAVVFTPRDSMEFDCIVRDSSGTLASNDTIPGLFPPHVAKAMGMREALSWL